MLIVNSESVGQKRVCCAVAFVFDGILLDAYYGACAAFLIQFIIEPGCSARIRMLRRISDVETVMPPSLKVSQPKRCA